MDRDNHALIHRWQMHWKYVCFSSLHWQNNLMYNSPFFGKSGPMHSSVGNLSFIVFK